MFHDRATAFTRATIAKACGADSPRTYAEIRWGVEAAKAVVVGLTTDDSHIVAEPAVQFLDAVEEVAVVGRLPLRPTPLNVRSVYPIDGTTAAWTKEGQAVGLSRMTLAASAMRAKKLQGLTAISNEVLRFANADAERAVRTDLIRAAVTALDSKFLSTDAAADESPAGALRDISPVVSDTDKERGLAALIAAFAGDLTRAYLVARPDVFTRATSFSRGTVGARGGELLGIPAIASRNAPADQLILIDPDRIPYGSVGARAETSRSALIHVAMHPIVTDVDDGAGGVTGLPSTDLVSLWQENCTGFIIELLANWTVLPGAVSILDVEAWSFGGDSPGA